MAPILEVKDLHYKYGEIHAVKGISLHVEDGEIVTIIGANGAGKTTTLRTISGLLGNNAGGEIYFMGQRIDKLAPNKVAATGLVQILEGRLIFPQLTVRENLMMGAFLRYRDKAGVADSLEYVFNLFPRLLEREKQLGGTLSGGEQQMLAVGRGLMAKPKLLMMDEPSLGLAPLIVRDIFSTITKINADGVPILLVEQNSAAALHVASRGYVMETGHVVLEGSSKDLSENEDVKKAYLGGGH